jgi:valyl-tRNA synthetase
MPEQLSKVYQSKDIESQAQEIWDESRSFHADPDNRAKSYAIVIPPPNVTAALHLGHALNNTLQDILVRYHRMMGFNTLWMPGTDHAGIATQTVVEKRLLAEQGKRRTDFEREDFVAHVQAWKDEYEARIIEQLKTMGCSCDWGRTRFTMDKVCAKAVRATFFKLFEDGLIYRGKRLVNWDPATQTVLADDEVEHETVEGSFWYMRYPLKEAVEVDGERIEYVTVATTRPETMLGDTAVAMNPKDPRAEKLLGRTVILPIVGREIRIIADDYVVLPDPESEDEKAKYGTGFLKVTPAHDPNDWEIGQRNELAVINVMAPDGTISDKHGWNDAGEDAEFLLGMDRFEAREAIVEWFRNEKLLAEVRSYAHEVGHSYRSHVPIEPYLSDQWYIAVKKPIEHLADKFGDGLIEGTDVPVNSLAGLALKPLLDGRLRFTPERYAKNYQGWLENLRDWPISRQLWWGHRIPIWQCDDCGEYTSGVEDPSECGKCGSKNITQDDDVLDTWFSSALWPFSTMGWPEDTPEMRKYYPGSVLCTAREIITLWVSRMVMMGQYCAGDIPFSDVYIHAMIQDGQGRKMSKSLGNGIDPLVAIDSHGADAMRFTLADMTTDTQDVRMPVEPMELPDGRTVNTSPKFDIGRNLCNKLWNASRFAMMNLEDTDAAKFDPAKIELTDMWILSALARTIAGVTAGLEQFKFNEPVNMIYRFFWNDLCDWYLEWCKPRMRDEQRKVIAQNVLAFVLDQTLRLMHPFMPFITESIFQKLNEIVPERQLGELVGAERSEQLVTAKWPGLIEHLMDHAAENQISLIQVVIRAVREIRSQYNIPPSKKLEVSAAASNENADILNTNSELVTELAGLNEFSAKEKVEKPANSASSVVGDIVVYVHNVIDPAEELKRLEKQKAELEGALKGTQSKLDNENFVNKAKPEVVEQARKRREELLEQIAAVQENIKKLG